MESKTLLLILWFSLLYILNHRQSKYTKEFFFSSEKSLHTSLFTLLKNVSKRNRKKPTNKHNSIFSEYKEILLTLGKLQMLWNSVFSVALKLNTCTWFFVLTLHGVCIHHRNKGHLIHIYLTPWLASALKYAYSRQQYASNTTCGVKTYLPHNL